MSFLADEPDFMARSITLTFSPSVTSIEVPIRIIDDLLLEMLREQFTSALTLVTTDLAINLQPASVPINIIDDDGRCNFYYLHSAFIHTRTHNIYAACM